MLSTGDEIVMPGEPVGPGQIVSLVRPRPLAALVAPGAAMRPLRIVRDEPKLIEAASPQARRSRPPGHQRRCLGRRPRPGAGRHFEARASTLDFWRIAMRPGKPLDVGPLRPPPVLGYPGNPVSAMVCASCSCGRPSSGCRGCAGRSPPDGAAIGCEHANANDPARTISGRPSWKRTPGGLIRLPPSEGRTASMLLGARPG